MESDSDNFESADENLSSDEEPTKIETKPSKEDIKNEKVEQHVIKSIKSISIEEKTDQLIEDTPKVIEKPKEVETSKNELDITKVVPESNVEQPVSKNVERQLKRDKNKVKERPTKMKSKLGVKLGTKIEKKVDFDVEQPKQMPEPCWEEETGWEPYENTPKYSQKSEELEKNYWSNEDEYMELPKKENFQNVSDKLSAGDRPQSSWSSWGNWGVSSILSTATLGVSTLTNSVSQGITTVLESGIGIPDPEELAKIDKMEKEKRNMTAEIREDYDSLEKDNSERPSGLSLGLGNFVSGVSHITKLVETTGTKVVSGGLSTLEVIGKKTMEVLQEGDPGFKKKKAFLGLEHEKPVLSQVLREAKEKAEEENKFLQERHFETKAHYETLFDDHQGLVHLEALEMLSKQCDIKLESLLDSKTGTELTEFQETLAQIKELCEIPDDDEELDNLTIEIVKDRLESALSELNVNITYENLIKTWNEIDNWLNDVSFLEKDIHMHSIETLAKLTAISVEQFHKAGELLLIKDRRSTVDEADSLVQLTTTLTSLIGLAAAKFSEKLNALAEFSNDPDSVNSLITNIFLEAANSSSYIQDAFHLLIPVLQVGAV